MTTQRGFERLIAFSDAVVAIALTLLVLPLVDLPGDIADGTSVGRVLADAHNELIAFAVSFLVIWRLWTGHHRIFRFYRAMDHPASALNVGWLATIVVLPFPTALLSTPVAEHGAVALYLAVLLASTVLLQALAWRVRHHSELADNNDPEAREWLAGRSDWVLPGSMALALVLSLVFPEAGPWMLLVLLLPTVVDQVRTGVGRVAGRRRAGRRRAGASPAR
jgi:uncharacterized membrane protein